MTGAHIGGHRRRIHRWDGDGPWGRACITRINTENANNYNLSLRSVGPSVIKGRNSPAFSATPGFGRQFLGERARTVYPRPHRQVLRRQESSLRTGAAPSEIASSPSKGWRPSSPEMRRRTSGQRIRDGCRQLAWLAPLHRSRHERSAHRAIGSPSTSAASATPGYNFL
jgi:hypothetical protein